MKSNLKPIRKTSLAEAAYCQLRDSILCGEYAPGDALPGERVLSESMEVNRGAIREALKRLEQSRLVEIHQGGNTRVLDFRSTATLEIISQLLVRPDGRFDLDIGRSMIELRAVIQPDMTRLAAMRADPELPGLLRDLVAEMQRKIDDVEWVQILTDDFWALVATHSENLAYRLILNTIREIRESGTQLLSKVLKGQYRDFSHLEEIIDAIERKDPEAAESAARRRSKFLSNTLLGGGPPDSKSDSKPKPKSKSE